MPKIYIECDCHSELIQLEHDQDDDLLYLSFYACSLNGHRYGIKNRLRHIWKIIKDGHPYSDAIVLNRSEREKLETALKFFNTKGILNKRKGETVMTQAALRIFEKYQSLSPEEKDELVEMINLNHEFQTDPEIEKAWAEEAEHRISEFEKGNTTTVPACEVFKNIRDRIR